MAKVERGKIIEDIQRRCENIKSIMHEANVSQDEILNRVDNLLGKIQ